MSIAKGSIPIVDRYKGSQLVEKVYKGQTKIFDAYTDVFGALPLSFTARADHNLKNYRLYGTSEGAGVQTENLFEVYSNSGGYVDFETGGLNVTIDRHNQSIIVNNTSTIRYPQAFIKGPQGALQLSPNKTYTTAVTTDNSPENAKIYLMIQGTLDNSNWITIVSTINNPLVAFSFTENYVNYRYLFVCEGTGLTYNNTKVRFSIVEGEVSSYIPYGYQIPLTLTSGQNTDTYPLYIGDTKLGAEESVDYESGKVYKRTENFLPVGEKCVFNIDENTTLESDGNGRYILNGIVSNTTVFPIIMLSKAADILNGKIIYAGNSDVQNKLKINFLCYDISTPSIGVTLNSQWKTVSTYPAEMNAAKIYAIRLSCTSATDITVNNLSLTPMLSISSLDNFIPYLQPTDPPAPFPAITAYAGENVLSSTETVGSVTVTGRISEVQNG